VLIPRAGEQRDILVRPDHPLRTGTRLPRPLGVDTGHVVHEHGEPCSGRLAAERAVGSDARAPAAERHALVDALDGGSDGDEPELDQPHLARLRAKASAVRQRVQASYGVNFGNERLAEGFAAEEIPSEVADALRRVAELQN